MYISYLTLTFERSTSAFDRLECFYRYTIVTIYIYVKLRKVVKNPNVLPSDSISISTTQWKKDHLNLDTDNRSGIVTITSFFFPDHYDLE